MDPNTPLKIFGRFIAFIAIAFGPVIAALILNQWYHDAAVILANLWLVAAIIVMSQRRAPCYYDSYRAWYADRANWWKKFPQRGANAGSEPHEGSPLAPEN